MTRVEFVDKDFALLRERALKVQRVFDSLPKNREFSIPLVAPIIAQELGVGVDEVTKILQEPKIDLFDGVSKFFERALSHEVLPVIWTQGEVGPEGFQPLKIRKSGLIDFIAPYQYIYDRVGIPSIVGAPNKLAGDVVLPVLSAARARGYTRFFGADDRADTLHQLFPLVQRSGFQDISMYHILQCEGQFGESDGLYRARRLSEIPLTPGAFLLIDFDRTSGDTDRMKERYVEDLAVLSFGIPS